MNFTSKAEETKVKPTEHIAKTPSPKTGFFAALRGVLHVEGSGAPSRASLALALTTVASVLGLLAFGSAPALALNTHAFERSFGSAGTGAGQLDLVASSGPNTSARAGGSGVAVDNETGDIYVADTGNDRIDEFEANGTFVRAWGWGVVTGGLGGFEVCTPASLGGCKAGVAGSGAGQFTTPVFIAVDNSSGPSKGDVYVGDTEDELISKFTAEGALVESWGVKGQLNGSTVPGGPFKALAGVAVDASGTLLVANDVWEQPSQLFEFAQEGAFSKEFLAVARETNPSGLAVDAEGDFFKANGEPSVEEVTASGVDVGQVSQNTGTSGLAVSRAAGADGGLYVDQGDEVGHYAFAAAGVVSEPGASTCAVASHFGCAASDTFGADQFSGGAGIGVDSLNGNVYVAATSVDQIDVFDQVTLPDLVTEGPSGASETAATLQGTVNPDETKVTACEFEYGTEPGAYSNTVACSQTLPLTGNTPVAVSAPLSGLQPFTLYYYRVSATNADGTDYGSQQSFTLPAPPRISSVSAQVEQTGKAGQTNATLTASIDPDGSETTYRFEFGETSSYGTSVPINPSALGSGEQFVPVTAELSGLKIGTTYHYRVVASNTYGSPESTDQTFTTLPPALIEDSAANVAATSATLNAQINPLGRPTTCKFQYVTDSDFQATGYDTATTVGCPAVGSGENNVDVGPQYLQSLLPGTLYHYRVVTSSEINPGEYETFDGPDHTFTTQAAHGSFTLIDGRQWEMVSPPQKLGALIEGAGESENLVQAAAEGDAITYRATSPTETEPHGGFSNAETIFSARGVGGWSSQDISVAHDHFVNVTETRGHEYQIFSEDLSRAALQPVDSALTLLSPEASESTAYLRSDFLDGNQEDLCTSSCYRPLVTGKAGFANVPTGTVFGEEPTGHCELKACGPRFEGANPALTHIVLSSPAQLTSTPAPAGGPGLYEWSEGSLQLLDVPPSGEEGPAELAGSVEQLGVRHSVSNDGERVIMERVAQPGSTVGIGLYLRDVAAGVTIRLDVPQGGIGPSGYVSYMDASSDASRIFFLDSGRLTADSSPSGEDLYEYNVNAPAGSRLTDLTADPHPGQSADVQMMLGASEDGSYVYFAAAGALAASAAETTCCNLYVRHAGVTRLVAVLPSSDGYDWSRTLQEFRSGSPLLARVSPNGRWLAFMSQAELTGYDTHDAASGQQDAEVYLYHAPAAPTEGGALICASCDPTGARPVGELGEKKRENGGLFSRTWVAGNVVPWDGFTYATEYGVSLATHQPRYLSDSGRLFFDSTDALVPQDVDGVEDVYEYEPEGMPAGEHACSSASTSGSVVFKPARSFDVEGRVGEESAGCVGLISSGTSSERSWFLDASESGGDVFFITQARLAPQDADTAFDVYDAHECAAASPCTPVASSPPPCDTEASCKAAPEPQPSLFGLPSSATFSGAGNVTPPAPAAPVKAAVKKPAKCPKGKARNKHHNCVKVKKKQTKAKKSAHSDRRASR
jgi:hypothetical protein